MTDIETTLRRGLEAFDDATTAVATPDLAAVLRRAGAPDRARRRWPKVGAAMAAGVIATSGAAAAVGVLPGPVEATLREFRSWGYHADLGAERMASTTDDGFTYELWLAPLDGGGWCSSVLVDGPAGEVDHGGGSACHPTERPPARRNEFFDLAYPERVSDNSRGTRPGAAGHATAWGRVPAGATQVLFELDNAPTWRVETQREGWFITTFPGVADGTRIMAVRAVDANGRVLASSGGG